MGIYLCLCVSKSITQEEWEPAYEKALSLAKDLGLAERRIFKDPDGSTIYLSPVEEREDNYFDPPLGWTACGDVHSEQYAEEFHLPRVLTDADHVIPDAPDAMIGAIADNVGKRDDRFRYLWFNKTQGRPYHIRLLAVATLLESELGSKVFTYGNVTLDEFKKAVELANYHLDDPILVPDRCNPVWLLERVSKISAPADAQMYLFDEFFLGRKDSHFAEYVRKFFPEEEIQTYWKKHFLGANYKSWDKANGLSEEYIRQGFDRENLVDLIDQDAEQNRKKAAAIGDKLGFSLWWSCYGRFVLADAKDVRDWEDRTKLLGKLTEDELDFLREHGFIR
jgi:hypothetical protein